MEFVNLTPHAIAIATVLDDGDDTAVTVQPSGSIARVSMDELSVRPIEDEYGNGIIPVITRKAGAVTGLPAPREGVNYLVSGMVLDALAGSVRFDVFAPDTGPTAVRNDKGHITAVRRLVGVAS